MSFKLIKLITKLNKNWKKQQQAASDILMYVMHHLILSSVKPSTQKQGQKMDEASQQ